MVKFPELRIGFLVALVFLSSNLMGQAVSASQSFHVQGTVTDRSQAVVAGAEVTFKSEKLMKTLVTNSRGVYEADLPVGEYTMTVTQKIGLRFFQRPLFCVLNPSTIFFDVSLPVGAQINRVVYNNSGQPMSAEEMRKALTSDLSPPYYGERLFPNPPAKGVPFQLYIRYVWQKQRDDIFEYSGAKNSSEDPVFIAYDLFSLEADHVSYDSHNRVLSAEGNVSVSRGSGTIEHADSIRFHIEDGEATQVQ